MGSSSSPEPGGRPKVLLAIDRPGWAFDHIAAQLVRHLEGELDVSVVPYPRVVSGTYDVVVAFWWASVSQLRANLKLGHLVLCLYDKYSWTRPEAHGPFLLALQQADSLAVANERIVPLVSDTGLPVYVVEDGVDTTLFSPRPMPGGDFTLGWTGNSGGPRSAGGPDDLKGLGIIREACRMTGVAFVVADAHDDLRPHYKMPDWYGGLHAYACASQCEGTPNPVLEAMACGRPVITTDVGLVRRIVANGENGVIVKRSVEAFAAGISRLRGMDLARAGRLARVSAEAHDWRLKIPAWRACLLGALESA